MSDPWRILLRRYGGALRRHLHDRQEESLQRGYELGRQAVSRGLGVLDMARAHLRTLESCVPQWPDGRSLEERKAAEEFCLESLSAFEMTHRGFRETNRKLQEVVELLAERNGELARANRELALEVRERKRTERALRESERHFRQLFRRADIMQQNLRNLSNQVLHAQEQERKRISRELHDEVSQALTAIHVSLAVLQSGSPGAPHGLSRRIADAQGLLKETMDTVHRFARELRPAMLDELGLLPALRSYVAGFAERTGLKVEFRATAQAEMLDDERKLVVFRVVQESLTNVAKHARARRVNLRLRPLKMGLRLDIEDDGVSFRPDSQDTITPKKRLGLLGMRERVRLINGKLVVTSRRNSGTRIRVDIPLRPARRLATPPRRVLQGRPHL